MNKTIEFVSQDISDLKSAEDWLLANGFEVNGEWSVLGGNATLENFPKEDKRIVLFSNSVFEAHNLLTHAISMGEHVYRTLDEFKEIVKREHAPIRIKPRLWTAIDFLDNAPEGDYAWFYGGSWEEVVFREEATSHLKRKQSNGMNIESYAYYGPLPQEATTL